MTERGPLADAQQQLAELRHHSGSFSPEQLNAALSRLEQTLGDLSHQMDTQREQAASFSSTMVHELRKPMTSIRGYADMLTKTDMVGPLNDMQRQFVETIRSNVLRMEGLVSDISDLSKLGYGKLVLDNKMTTFSQVMIEVSRQSEALNAEFGHTVHFEVPQGLPLLTIDSKQLVKVIAHLLRNAMMYTPKGSGQITLTASREDGNRLKISIRDNGIGMKAEDAARLGEPFFRADHELVYSQKGYGLGVPVAIGLLRLMGTQLEWQTAPDQGSTFSFGLAGM